MDTKTVAYVRISREEAQKIDFKYSNSIENQISYIKNFAYKNDIDIDKFYIDDGYSGINYDRPEFEKLKNEIFLGKINLVITKDISRLGREYIETLYYIYDLFPKNNIRYIAIDDLYDSNNTKNSDTFYKLKALFNDIYIKEISKKIIRSKNINSVKNNFHSAIAPYGYIKSKCNGNVTLEIDYKVKKNIEIIFVKTLLGENFSKICCFLNKQNVKPPSMYKNKEIKGKKWTERSIYSIIRNAVYAGHTVIKKSEKLNYKLKVRKNIFIHDRNLKLNTHKAIIDNELFRKVQLKVKKRKKKEKRKNTYDFSIQKFKCGYCGKSLNVSSFNRNNSGNIYTFFYCNSCKKMKKINYEKCLKILKYVFNFIQHKSIKVNDQKYIKDLLNIVKEIKINEINLKINYYNDIIKFDFNKIESYDLYKKDIKLISNKICILQSKINDLDYFLSSDKIMKIVENRLNNLLFNIDYIINNFIDKVVILNRNDITIFFNFNI